MKKVLIISLIGILSLNNVFSQELCIDTFFYEQDLSKIKDRNNNRVVVKYDFKLSESLKSSIFSISLFTEDEKQIIQDSLLENNYVPCNKILKTISSLKNRPIDEKLKFISLRYSKPIFVSDNKVYIFYEIGLKRENDSSIKGGGTYLKIFQKKENVWEETDKKTLEYY